MNDITDQNKKTMRRSIKYKYMNFLEISPNLNYDNTATSN